MTTTAINRIRSSRERGGGEGAGDEVSTEGVILFAVESAQAGERLDRVLVAGAPDLSRSRLKALIEAGEVSIDGRTIRDAAYRVKPGQQARVVLPEPEPAVPQGEDIPLVVVHEDDALIVLDKPAGLVVHPGAGHATGTLVNALIAHCGDSLSGIGGVRRPGIVHRLDKDTSGLIVAAKSDAAHRHLAAQFADHGRTGILERRYLALAWGVPGRRRGTIESLIDREARNRLKMAVQRSQGRVAITHYEIRETFGDVACLVECRLETGRTHQIRVHLAHIGHPVLGDDTYGAGFRTKARRLGEKAAHLVEGLGRQALHAAVLGFEHPVSGEVMHFESLLPEDLAAVKDALAEG